MLSRIADKTFSTLKTTKNEPCFDIHKNEVNYVDIPSMLASLLFGPSDLLAAEGLDYALQVLVLGVAFVLVPPILPSFRLALRLSRFCCWESS